MNRKHSHAFTLVELLVVIAIIGILVSMILPGIQSAREAARRNLCLNRMRELILAVHNYEMAYEVFPPGTTNETGPIENRPEGQHISWIAQVLPYIGEQNKFEHLDLEAGAYDSKNDEIRRMIIPGLVCPSDVNRVAPMTGYAASQHDVEAPIDADNNGVFFLNSQLSADDLEDGAKYTLFLGEKATIAKFDLGWLSGTAATLRNAGASISDDQAAASRGGSAPWLIKGNHSAEGGNPDEPLKVGGFGSFHVDGANFAFGDGSVRFLAAEIPVELLQQLANRSDGALIDSAEMP